MFWKRVGSLVLAALLALGVAAPVQAQSEIDALVMWDVRGSGVLAHGCRELGYTLTEARSSEAEFITFLSAQSWDFVGIELPFDTITQKETVVRLLEDHVAAGGALIVNYNHLNEWPRLQRLLGVASTSPVPLMQDVFATNPKHCTWFGASGIGYAFQGQPPDPGDVLEPVPGAMIIGKFSNGDTAMLLGAREATIANGFDWGSYEGTTGTARRQIAYVVECRADLDRSTGRQVLDIFDFLAFQDAFVRQLPCANMAFDENFDIFDFLAFQDAFVTGCR